MEEEKIEQAQRLLDHLAEQNPGLMGLSPREEGIFDTLLWLLSDGEPLNELQDLEE